MDERDLYIPPRAAEAEVHPIGGEQGHDILSYDTAEIPHQHHVGDQPIEEESVPASTEGDLLGLSSSPVGDQPASHPYAGATGGGHEPNVDELHDLLGSGGGDGNPTAYSNYGFNLGRDGNEGEAIEERINAAVTDLTGEREGHQGHKAGEDYQPPHKGEQSPLPQSSSITGMRNDDEGEEETNYDRKGPLTIPTQHRSTANDDDGLSQEEVEKMRSHNWPRPPTPPKVLDDQPEEQKPKVVDLSHSGSHPHHLSHKESKTGLHSILKNNGSGEWWSSMDGLNPKVLEIIYWRDPKKSAGVLASTLLALYLFARCTLLSLAAYGSLAVLASALGFRLYKIAEGQIKKTHGGSNPFQPYLEQEVSVPREKVHEQVDVWIEHGQALVKHLRHLFLVESVVDSVKFGLLLYTLTYVGAWFSGISLILIFVLAVFSVPKVYELYKDPIDHYVAIVQEHVEKAQNTVEHKLPFLKKITSSSSQAEPSKKEQ